jgi:tRNA A-37 threonylcarbamoyl transferase component Bud32
MGKFMGKDVVIKERFSKKYRHEVLDQKILSHRMKAVKKNDFFNFF